MAQYLKSKYSSRDQGDFVAADAGLLHACVRGLLGAAGAVDEDLAGLHALERFGDLLRVVAEEVGGQAVDRVVGLFNRLVQRLERLASG